MSKTQPNDADQQEIGAGDVGEPPAEVGTAGHVADVLAAAEQAKAGAGEVSGEVVRHQGDEASWLDRFIPDQDPDRTAEDIAYMAIIEQVLSSATPEDVLTPIEAMGIEHFADVALTVESFDFIRSEYEVGSPYYAAIKVKIEDTGRREVMTTGNQKVIAQLVTLHSQDALPQKCRVTQTGMNKRYKKPIWQLVPTDWQSRKPTPAST